MLKKSIIVNLFILIIYIIIYSFSLFEIPQEKINDFANLLRWSQKIEANHIINDDIVCVTVDDATQALVRKRWPWPRSVTAQIISNLNKAQPKTIALDFGFIGETTEPEDKSIIEAFSNAGNVLVSAHLGSGGEYVTPYEPIAESVVDYGIINKPREKDFVIRRSRAMIFTQNNYIINMSLAIKAVANFLDIPLKNLSSTQGKILLRDKEKTWLIPINPVDGTMMVNFVGKPGNFHTLSAWKVLEDNFNYALVKDKLILVGTTAKFSHDEHKTPLGIMPGMFINANEINSILKQEYITRMDWHTNLLINIGTLLIISIVVAKLSIAGGFLTVLLATLITWIIGYAIFYFFNYQIDLFSIPFMSLVFYTSINLFKYIMTSIDNARLQKLAITDGLTGLFQRRYFAIRLERDIEKFKRYGEKTALLMIDIDHFKKINDDFGHQQGDVALKTVADIIRNNCRQVDLPARYGGEEFVLVLNNTPLEGALMCAEKIRKASESTKFEDIPRKITLSIGIAALETNQDLNLAESEHLIKAADEALYRAKEQGRNRVIAFKNRKGSK